MYEHHNSIYKKQMNYGLKLYEIIYKRLIKGPAPVERGSDRKHLRIVF